MKPTCPTATAEIFSLICLALSRFRHARTLCQKGLGGRNLMVVSESINLRIASLNKIESVPSNAVLTDMIIKYTFYCLSGRKESSKFFSPLSKPAMCVFVAIAATILQPSFCSVVFNITTEFNSPKNEPGRALFLIYRYHHL